MARAWVSLNSSGSAAATIAGSSDHDNSLLQDLVTQWAGKCTVVSMHQTHMTIHNIVNDPFVLNARS